MNHTINALASPPTESRISVCAPHLVTSFGLMDGNPTRRAIFGVFFKHLCGGNITGIANMIREGVGGFDALWNHSLNFMTRGANLNIAHLAPPLTAQETIAVGSGTWLDKLAGWFRRLLVGSLTISKMPHTRFGAINLILNNA